MKPGLPWSIKGIEPDAREAAKQAARRSGMTLGEWLNSRILDESDETPAPVAARALPQHRERPNVGNLERTASRLECRDLIVEFLTSTWTMLSSWQRARHESSSADTPCPG